MIEVRHANESDASAIARVRAESWRAAYRGIVPDAFLDGMDVGGWAEVYRRLLGNPPGKMASFVAEADAKGRGNGGNRPESGRPHAVFSRTVHDLPGTGCKRRR